MAGDFAGHTIPGAAAVRVVQTFVTFRSSFNLPGLSGPLQPGTYGTVTLQEKLDGNNFTGWNSVSTSFRVPAIGGKGKSQYTAISPDHLSDALLMDLRSLQSIVDI